MSTVCKIYSLGATQGFEIRQTGGGQIEDEGVNQGSRTYPHRCVFAGFYSN